MTALEIWHVRLVCFYGTDKADGHVLQLTRLVQSKKYVCEQEAFKARQVCSLRSDVVS